MPLCHLADRAVLRLSGADTRAFLQGQITHDIARLAADRPLHAGLLSPQGKALFQLFLFADGEDVLVDVAAGQREALERRLLMFRLRRQVAIEPVPGLGVWQQWGEASAHPPDPRLANAGARFLAAGLAATATLADWHRHRLSLGLPDADEIGHDDLLWLETNARELDGVSFTKGCFTGQENTARMHYRDKLRKRLLPVRLSGPSAPAARLMAGDRAVGDLRGARHGDLQMALVRVDEARGVPLAVDGAPAELLWPAWLPAWPVAAS